VRSETEVGLRPVSIAAVAVRLAQDLHGALAETRVLLLGAGDMGELVAEHLLAAGVKRLMVMAPRLKSAETLAQSLGAQSLHVQVASFEQLGQRLIDADIVVSAVGARQATLSAEQVGLALRRRRRQPMFLIDTAIPGDIEPAANRLEGAYLYDLADLERLAMAGRATRASAAQQALVIVDEMVEAFFLGRAERHAVPAILLLRQHAETLRRQALTDAGGDAEEATRLLVNRLLHDPSDVMKQLAAGEQGWPAAEELLKQLFRLPG
jgi:glutamyl-tRNA reductase